jgi:hypothetical protein
MPRESGAVDAKAGAAVVGEVEAEPQRTPSRKPGDMRSTRLPTRASQAAAARCLRRSHVPPHPCGGAVCAPCGERACAPGLAGPPLAGGCSGERGGAAGMPDLPCQRMATTRGHHSTRAWGLARADGT